MPKMHQNTLAAGLHPDPLAELRRFPDLAAIEGVLFLRVLAYIFQSTGFCRTAQPH